MDGGANTSISNDLSLFSTFWRIPDYNIGGVAAGTEVICTHRGIFHMRTRSGTYIPILIYYSKDASCTVVSPTDTVFQSTDFSYWT